MTLQGLQRYIPRLERQWLELGREYERISEVAPFSHRLVNLSIRIERTEGVLGVMYEMRQKRAYER